MSNSTSDPTNLEEPKLAKDSTGNIIDPFKLAQEIRTYICGLLLPDVAIIVFDLVTKPTSLISCVFGSESLITLNPLGLNFYNKRDLDSAMDWAADYNHLDMVKWLHANNYSCTYSAMDQAASNGNLEMVKWLHIHRSEGSTTSATINAAKKWSFRNNQVVTS